MFHKGSEFLYKLRGNYKLFHERSRTVELCDIMPLCCRTFHTNSLAIVPCNQERCQEVLFVCKSSSKCELCVFTFRENKDSALQFIKSSLSLSHSLSSTFLRYESPYTPLSSLTHHRSPSYFILLLFSIYISILH